MRAVEPDPTTLIPSAVSAVVSEERIRASSSTMRIRANSLMA